MKKIQLIIVLLLVLIASHSKASSLEMPSFLPQYFAPALKINGESLKFVNHSEKDGVEQYLYFTDDKSLTLLIENITCDRPRGAAIFKNIIGNLNDRINSKKGEFLIISKSNIHAKIYEDDKEKIVFVYVLPKAVQIWTYVTKSNEKNQIGSQFKIIGNFINKQRYNEALLEGNVSMGIWGDAIYEYAGELLHENKKKEALEVLEKLLVTSPYNYKAHMDYVENADNLKAAVNNAKIIIRGSENPALVTKAAKFLDKKIMTFDSIPYLENDEKGLQLILIPLTPCDVSLLEEVSEKYKIITNIPVKIRRIKEEWKWDEPDRIPHQRFIQETLVKWKGEDINFKDWDKEKYIGELKKFVETKEAIDKYYTNELISKIKKEDGQYFVDIYLNRLLNIIEKYRSDDELTMYVGVTGINIYSGDSNYVFSSGIKQDKSRAFILSYYMMTADNLSEEYESRNRLTDRIAKELVPPSLQQLGIPRSTDPTCPYSYSSGVSRLDQKTLILSEEVKNMIDKMNPQRANTPDTSKTHQ